MYQDGVLQGTTLVTSYTVQGLLQCQQYQAKVEALCGDGVLMSVKTVTAHTGNVERDEASHGFTGRAALAALNQKTSITIGS